MLQASAPDLALPALIPLTSSGRSATINLILKVEAAKQNINVAEQTGAQITPLSFRYRVEQAEMNFLSSTLSVIDAILAKRLRFGRNRLGHQLVEDRQVDVPSAHHTDDLP